MLPKIIQRYDDRLSLIADYGRSGSALDAKDFGRTLPSVNILTRRLFPYVHELSGKEQLLGMRVLSYARRLCKAVFNHALKNCLFGKQAKPKKRAKTPGGEGNVRPGT